MYQLRIAISPSGEVRRHYVRCDDRGCVRITRQAYQQAASKGKPCRVQIVVEEGADVVIVPGRGQEA